MNRLLRNLRNSGTIVLAFTVLIACRKSNISKPPDKTDTTVNNPPPVVDTPKPIYLARIVQGTGLSTDTVYKLSWQDSFRISTLVDSIKQDTLLAAYDAGGHLTAITNKGPNPYDAGFTYDSTGALTQINYTKGTSNYQYTFTYTNGIVSKKSYYTSTGSASLKLSTYFVYTYSDSNITDIKAYTSTGIMLADAVLTYGTEKNPFRNLCLFNYASRLNMDDIAPFEAYFNRNIVTSLTTYGMTAALANIFDSQQRLSGIVANDQINKKLYTWQYFYE
ncbi:MAG TPA: hypothetical protein VHD83_00495 [Puia sp.]|nr:hypothetical protein [Puia sp.]